MATPSYLGQGQPNASGGGWLASWLGTTPAYKGAGQCSQRSSMFGAAAPAYKPASAATNAAPPIAIVIPRDALDAHALDQP